MTLIYIYIDLRRIYQKKREVSLIPVTILAIYYFTFESMSEKKNYQVSDAMLLLPNQAKAQFDLLFL
jgi:hypothetical protein